MTLALILGGANSVWDELREARRLATPDLIIATNHAGRDFDEPLDHWATMHPELLPRWTDARAKAGRPAAGQLWTADHRPGPLPMRRIKGPGGSSGLLAVFVGLELGVDRMVLCGVPMHANFSHYDDQRQRRWTEARQYWYSWERALPRIGNRVRSFAGETRQMLGEPTGEWMNGRPDAQ